MFSHGQHNLRNEYISLTVDNLGRIDFTQPLLQRRSLWRVWMSLSKFQKNLIRLVILVVIVTVWLSISYSKSQPHKRKPVSFSGDTHSEEQPLQAPLREDPLHGESFDERSNQIGDTNLVEPNQLQEAAVNELENPGNEFFSGDTHSEEQPLQAPLREDPLHGESFDERSNQIGDMNLVEPNQLQEAAVNELENPGDIGSNSIKPIYFSKQTNARQRAVVDAFRHAWSAYKKYAWGQDMLKPLSKSAHKWFGLGLTIVDSLDTMWIMGLHDEFTEASGWVRDEFRPSLESSTADVNLFEATIRVLGGLLSAYHFSADDLFISKALDIGEALLPCFEKSPSGVPYSDVNLASHIPHAPRWSPDSSTAEVTTLQLEFRDLSRVTKLKKFEDASSRVSEIVHSLNKIDGLVPIYINPFSGKFKDNSEIKLGARGDSYYEYLLKQWIQTGKTKQFLIDDYLESVQGIQKHLVRRTPNRDLVFVGELGAGPREHKKFNPKMDHLVCFLPGTLALGYHHGMPESHMSLAHQLLDTCYYMYADQPTFLSPEIAYFNTEAGDIGSNSIKPIYFSKQTNARQRAVVDAFRHAWSAYKKYAWGQDMLKPLSKSAHKWFGLGLTIVDSLDTMWIMGLHDEFAEASGWVRDEFRPSLESSTADVNLFEATIRVLGGLLSAYHFSADDLFISKALDIGESIEKYCKTPSGYTAPKWETPSGYTSIGNVLDDRNVRPLDSMESFFLSETLKYLYLLLSDNRKLLDLDHYVLNSEAHPLPILSE
ncbi:endoplasmic reticulum mannosyl-oligosaccharide 1,2-alpha-mannosidase [Diaphorina citri]|uniref:alpha-1,2-Mannosidase n=1 Tax=Diaphorina citri TaxID=121845 RepID=A0A3Q0J083_DIACI|nr:endoplasmic reticulum mannosyl-oligosaccharide 1,2-alpha-mannosidase [Diaphorina citri]